MAVQQGIGSIVSSGFDIWNNAPEKVLCVSDSWHNKHPVTHARLRIALMQACQALSDRPMRERAADILSAEEYLHVPAKYLSPSLTGEYQFDKSGPVINIENFHVFWHYQACFPWRSHAHQLVKMSAETLGKKFSDEMATSLVQQCYRTDLYREAARLMDVSAPDSDTKLENSHDSEWELAPGIMLGADRLIDN